MSNEGLSNQQRSSLDSREVDHDRTLGAMHKLEAALSEAAPLRKGPWRDTVLAALATLERVTAEEAENAQRPDSLLFDIAHNQPRLRNRARDLRLRYTSLRESILAVRDELEAQDVGDIDHADIRHRLGQLLTALRYQRARESDLIYEAYFDAFKEELRRSEGS